MEVVDNNLSIRKAAFDDILAVKVKVHGDNLNVNSDLRDKLACQQFLLESVSQDLSHRRLSSKNEAFCRHL